MAPARLDRRRTCRRRTERAGEGAAAATVAIDAAPFRGVLPLPISALKSAPPVLRNPTNTGKAIALTFEQFNFGWTNNLDETEARALYEKYPWTGARADYLNADRGPLLILAGDNDTTVPTVISRAAFKLQSTNAWVAGISLVPGRGHSLVIDHGWSDIATIADEFVTRVL